MQAATQNKKRDWFKWSVEAAIAFLAAGSGIVALVGWLNGSLPHGPRAQFDQCRGSIARAVNATHWSQAQRIGIECTAKLKLEKNDADFADLTFWLGRAYEGDKKLEEALNSFKEAYEAAIGLQSNRSDRMAVDILLGMARVFRLQGRSDEARHSLNEVLSRAERLTPLEREVYVDAAHKELASL